MTRPKGAKNRKPPAKGVRNYVRLDTPTEEALGEVCRYYFSTKSAMMRKYIKEGIARDAADIAKQIEELKKNTRTMDTYA
jgi:hypothetical protein